MVDSIGSRLVTTDLGVTRVTATTGAPAASVKSDTLATPTVQAAELAQSLAATAPVDLARVERIRQAIADGDYPILPGTIADNMLALRAQLLGQGKN